MVVEALGIILPLLPLAGEDFAELAEAEAGVGGAGIRPAAALRDADVGGETGWPATTCCRWELDRWTVTGYASAADMVRGTTSARTKWSARAHVFVRKRLAGWGSPSGVRVCWADTLLYSALLCTRRPNADGDGKRSERNARAKVRLRVRARRSCGSRVAGAGGERWANSEGRSVATCFDGNDAGHV